MMISYASAGTEHTRSLIPGQSALEDMIRRPSLFWARTTLSSNSSRGRTSIESLRLQLGRLNSANRRIETDQNDKPSGGVGDRVAFGDQDFRDAAPRSTVMDSRRFIMCGWPPPGKRSLGAQHRGRLQSCVRPVDAVRMDCWP